MKTKEYQKEIKGMSRSDLVARAKSLAEEIMRLRFRKATGQLEGSHMVGQLKRNLARVKTALQQQSQSKGV